MRIFSLFKNKKENDNKLLPESKWVVEIIGSSIKAFDYDGNEKSLELNEVNQIIIETNDSGPLGTDVWWKISGKDNSLLVPGGATGETEMLEKFQTFKNFDNEILINAMSSIDNAKFIVWTNE